MAIADDILVVAEDIVRTKAKHAAEVAEMRLRQESELAPLLKLYHRALERAGLEPETSNGDDNQRAGGFKKDPNSISQRSLKLLTEAKSALSTDQIAQALDITTTQARYAMIEHQRKKRVMKPGTNLWKALMNGELEP